MIRDRKEKGKKPQSQGEVIVGWWVFYSISTLLGYLILNTVYTYILNVMVKALDCGIIVLKFKLQSCYYIQFWTNTLGKGMKLLILPSMG